jgi:heme oxygenase
VLRDRTSSAHGALDSGLAGHDHRVDERDDYVRLLTVLAELHASVEGSLHRWVESTPWVREALGGATLPSRTHLYADDLASLGEQSPAPHPVETYDDARGLACLYLLAGSSKGARVLLKGLPDDVAPGSRRGLGDAASRDSAVLWGAVVGLLGDPLEQAHPGDEVEVAAAAGDHAVDVFARLHRLAGPDRAGREAMAG